MASANGTETRFGLLKLAYKAFRHFSQLRQRLVAGFFVVVVVHFTTFYCLLSAQGILPRLAFLSMIALSLLSVVALFLYGKITEKIGLILEKGAQIERQLVGHQKDPWVF